MPIPGCKKRPLTSLALFFFSIPAFSAYGHIYSGASLGSSFAKPGDHSPTISYVSGDVITDAYPLNNNRVISPLLSVNAGYELSGAHSKPAVAFGLGVYRNLSNYDYNGHVIETAAGDAGSTLFNYNYNINSTRLMAEVQLTWMLETFSPFINLGMGPAWNQMQAYKETAVNGTGYTAVPPFQSRTNLNLAYQAGFGVSRGFDFSGSKSDVQKERVSLGYRYVNSGTSSFGTRGSSYPYQLNTGRFNSNDVYLGYIHLF